VQIHRCPAPGCGNVLVVKLAVDVVVRSKAEPVRQWWTPRLAE
jgi:hypothetical protein